MERSEHLTEAEHAAIESAKARAKLSPDQLMVLGMILGGNLAWSSEDEMVVAAMVMGCPSYEDVAKPLGELVSLGVVVEWTLAGKLQYTLSEHAAWMMQVHILERLSIRGEEIEEDPYWAELTKEAPPLHLPKRRHEIRWPWMDEVPDPKSLRRAGEVMRDEEGEPVKVLGMEVPVDHRLRGAAKQAKARRRAG